MIYTKEETESLELLRASGYEAVAKTLEQILLQKWAETKTLNWAKASGYTTIQQLDWIAKNSEGEWVIFEAKGKSLFKPQPFWGIGLNKSELWLRTQLLEALGWRTFLINFVPETDKVYGAFLDELEKGEFYDTRNKIRIYPISAYEDIHNALN